jgi:Type II secretion system protein B
VSYILDALKKAAEQRSGPSLEVRRLLVPAAVPAASRLRYVTLAAVAGGVIGVAAVLWMWMPTHDVSAPASQPVASVAAVPSPSAPASAASVTPPAVIPEEHARVPAEKKPRVPLVASEPKNEHARTSASDPRSTAPNVRPAEAKPPRTTPPAAAPAPPAPIVALLPPTAAPAAPARADVGKLKVEVIVYSEERPLRWAFISGRRYVEGDAIGDGARVEEIQSNGVVIVDDGRRITLRP